MFLRTRSTGAGAAVISGLCLASFAFADRNPLVTTETALVEEFTATWCVPCYGAYFALERLKDRWGDQVSIHTYSIADELDNPYNSRRETEEGIWAIPSFVFQGDVLQVGTPSDSYLDVLVQQALDAPRSARIIGRWKANPDTDTLKVGIKIEAFNDVISASTDELRIVVHESNWKWNCANGLNQYEHHVQGGFDERFARDLRPGEPETFVFEYDLSSNTYLRNWDEVGVTVYLFDTSTRKAIASWELGPHNLGDLDGDLNITRRDGRLFQRQVGKTTNDPDFNPAADWDKNGVIDDVDRDLFLEYVQNGGLR